MSKSWIGIFLLCLSFFIPEGNARLLYHGDLDVQIERITQQIEKTPSEARLYLKRGQLHANHNDFANARQDYVTARDLDSSLLITDLLMAQLLTSHHDGLTALTHVNIFLQQHPTHPEALISRAAIYRLLDQPDRCEKDLTSALAYLKTPTPSHYIAIANAVLRADSSNVEEAINWLNQGEEKFTFDIVLSSKKVELFAANQQYDQAILTIDILLQHFPRKEKWFFQKAMIYEQWNKTELAQTFYEATLNEIQKLPHRLQMTSKMLELQVQTLEKLQLLRE